MYELFYFCINPQFWALAKVRKLGGTKINTFSLFKQYVSSSCVSFPHFPLGRFAKE